MRALHELPKNLCRLIALLPLGADKVGAFLHIHVAHSFIFGVVLLLHPNSVP